MLLLCLSLFAQEPTIVSDTGKWIITLPGKYETVNIEGEMECDLLSSLPYYEIGQLSSTKEVSLRIDNWEKNYQKIGGDEPCILKFEYFLDERKHNCIIVEHLHNAYSDEPVFGKLSIAADGKQWICKLSRNKLSKIRPYQVENKFEGEKTGLDDKCSKNAFTIGCIADDCVSVYKGAFVQKVKVSRNCKIKVSFDYIMDRFSENPTLFEIGSYKEFGYGESSYDLISHKKLLTPRESKDKNSVYWQHKEYIVKTLNNTNFIGIEFKVLPVGKFEQYIFNVTQIDNLKLEVIGQSFTP
jgi:hypothetical protein